MKLTGKQTFHQQGVKKKNIKKYQSPHLTRYGSLKELTRSQNPIPGGDPGSWQVC